MRLTLTIFAALTVSAATAADRPNILFIFSDDHASHAISAYRDLHPDKPKLIETPNLDRIATEGMRFDNCFCTNSICGPSRAVILTGKHSHLNGFVRNGNTFDGSQQTFPKLLRKAGYQTAVIGKWHLGSAPTGFDHFEVLKGQGPYYNPPLRTKDGDGEKTVKTTGYTTDVITDRTLEWLQSGRDESKPFMLMFQHKCPHRNWQPAERHLNLFDDIEFPEPANLFDDYAGRGRAAREQDMEIATTLTRADLKFEPPRYLNAEQLAAWKAAYGPKNAAFEAMNLKGKDLVRWKYQRYIKDYLRTIVALDENVGRVLDYLDESHLSRNTIVMYSSDQGFYLGDHGWFDKRFMYEESYRMPLMARWPGVTPEGSVCKELVSNLDFAETFLDAAGAAIPGDMQGRSLVPLLRGETPGDWRDALYYHYYEFETDRRTAHMVRRHNGVRTKTHKLIDFYNIGERELYDMRKDPMEMQSVYGDPAYAEVQQDLEARLASLEKAYNVPDDRGSVPSDAPSYLNSPRGKKAREKSQTPTAGSKL